MESPDPVELKTARYEKREQWAEVIEFPVNSLAQFLVAGWWCGPPWVKGVSFCVSGFGKVTREMVGQRDSFVWLEFLF